MASSNETVTVDTLYRCVFCLRPADSTICLDLESLSFTQIFTYVQPDWTTDDEIEYKFVHGNKVLDTPPVCSFCSPNLLKIRAFHLEAVEIEKRLKEVRGKLDLQVKSIRGRMTRKESFQMKASGSVLLDGLFAERFNRLEKALRNNLRISRKIVEDTLSFLEQLQDGQVTSASLKKSQPESVPLPATGKPLVTSVVPPAAPVTTTPTTTTSGNLNVSLFTLVYENGAIGLRPLQDSSPDGGSKAAPDRRPGLPAPVISPAIQTGSAISLTPALPPSIVTSTSDITVPINYLPPTEPKRQMLISSKESIGTRKATNDNNPTCQSQPENLNDRPQGEPQMESNSSCSTSRAKMDEDWTKSEDGEDSIKSEVEEEDEVELQDLIDCREEEDPLWCESAESTRDASSPERVSSPEAMMVTRSKSKTPATTGRPRHLSPDLEIEVSTGVVTCEACSLKFPCEEMPDHMYDHVGVYACKCPNPKCNYTFVSRWSKGLERHLRRSRIGEADRACWKFIASHPQFLDWSRRRMLVYCIQCGERFKQPRALQCLQSHLNSHERNRRRKFFTCPVSNCVEEFSLRQSVEFHLAKDHPFPKVSEKRVRQPREDKPFPIGDPNWTYVDAKIEKGKDSKEQRCEVCGNLYLYIDMPQHMASHVGSEYVYKCPNPECFLTFVSKWSVGYISHLSGAAQTYKTNACWKAACDDPSVTSWKHIKKTCDICGEILGMVRYAAAHFTEHETPEKNFSCPICGARFTVRQSLEFHLRVHALPDDKGKPETEKCSLCKKDIQREEISQHLQHIHKLEKGKLNNGSKSTSIDKGTSLNTYEAQRCEVCGEHYPVTEMPTHMAAHVGAGYVYICPNLCCNYTFASKWSPGYFSHLVNAAKTYKTNACWKAACDDLSATSWKHIKKTCDICGEILSSVHSAGEHFKEHETPEKKFSCPICEERFTVRQSLEFHLRVHALPDDKGNSATVKCGLCKMDIQREKMSQHLHLIHQLEEKGKLNNGSKSTSIGKGTSLKTYEAQRCEVCGEHYPVTEMPTHMAAHVGAEYVYICPNLWCNFTFASKWSPGYFSHLVNAAKTYKTNACWKAACDDLSATSWKHIKKTCDICGEILSSVHSAGEHFKEHETPEKKFSCPICEERFTVRQSLEFHVGVHALPDDKGNSATLKCGLCKMDIQREKMSQHLQLIHFEKNGNGSKRSFVDIGTSFNAYKKQRCEVCGDHYPVTVISTHMASHVGYEYVYKCPNRECFFTFVSKWSAGYISHLSSAVAYKPNACWKVVCDDPSVTSWKHFKKTCDVCGEILTTVPKVAAHFEVHERSSEKNFSCPICDAKFTVRQSVEFHLREHALHPYPKMTARKLKSGTEKSSEISSDKSKEEAAITKSSAKSQEKSPTEKCSLCKKNIELEDMSQHLQTIHKLEEGNLLWCKKCPVVVINGEELVNHLVRHAREGNGVFCDLCQEEGSPEALIPISNGVTLKTHYFEKHGIGKKMVCEKDNCEFSTFSKFTMRNHLHVVHNGSPVNKFKCLECSPPKAFLTKNRLLSHNVRMHGADPFKCRYCSQTFVVEEMRRKHERFQHEGKEKRKFACHLCGSIRASRSSYKRHMATLHALLDEKKFKCDKCDKPPYRFFVSLKRHLLTEHGEGEPDNDTFVCETCGLKVASMFALEQHKRIHTGERPFQCEICGLRFRQKWSWKCHMKKHAKLGNSFRSRGTFDVKANAELRRQGIEVKRKRSRKK